MEKLKISSYYPSGQKLFNRKGLEYNFNNFINNFQDKIDQNELNIITSGNKKSIKTLKSTKLWKWSIINNFLRLFQIISSTLACAVVVSVPYYYLVLGGKSIIDLVLTYTFFIYALIAFIVSFILTIILSVYDKKLGAPLEAIRLA